MSQLIDFPIDGFHGTFYHGNWRALHTMLPAGWSISTSHDPLPSSCLSKQMLWNPSIVLIHFEHLRRGQPLYKGHNS